MNFLEKLSRKNIYIYIFSKYLYQNYFYKFFFEEEFKILKYIQNRKKRVILDIGSNSGVSAKSIRLFNKYNKIISFEPNKNLASKLLEIKKREYLDNDELVEFVDYRSWLGQPSYDGAKSLKEIEKVIL